MKAVQRKAGGGKVWLVEGPDLFQRSSGPQGVLGLGAQSGGLSSDPVLVLVLDLVSPARVFHHSCRNK